MQIMAGKSFHAIGLVSFAFMFAGYACAGTIVVQSTDVIYAAGSQSSVAAGAGGTVPGGISLTSLANFVSFSSVSGSLASSGGNPCASPEGCIVLNNGSGNNPNDPDGTGANPSTSSETGSGSISGMTGPGAGYLVGVFVGAGGPSGPAPAALNFLGGGLGTAFTSLSPLLDQVFFIGDGLTGDGAGTVQDFFVPTGATELYLGVSDACGYNGGPSCYGDNLGTFTAAYSVTNNSSGVPEPGSLFLLGTGVLTLAAMRRRTIRRPRE
jgi:hypothetical protein